MVMKRSIFWDIALCSSYETSDDRTLNIGMTEAVCVWVPLPSFFYAARKVKQISVHVSFTRLSVQPVYTRIYKMVKLSLCLTN
jgi:hypothetical protein